MIRSRFFKVKFFSREFLIHGCFSSLFLRPADLTIETDTQPLGCNLQLLKVIERKPDSVLFSFAPDRVLLLFSFTLSFDLMRPLEPFAALFSHSFFFLLFCVTLFFRLFAVSQCDHFSSSSAFRCTARVCRCENATRPTESGFYGISRT